jgi:hypothetical protein
MYNNGFVARDIMPVSSTEQAVIQQKASSASQLIVPNATQALGGALPQRIGGTNITLTFANTTPNPGYALFNVLGMTMFANDIAVQQIPGGAAISPVPSSSTNYHNLLACLEYQSILCRSLRFQTSLPRVGDNKIIVLPVLLGNSQANSVYNANTFLQSNDYQASIVEIETTEMPFEWGTIGLGLGKNLGLIVEIKPSETVTLTFNVIQV